MTETGKLLIIKMRSVGSMSLPDIGVKIAKSTP